MDYSLVTSVRSSRTSLRSFSSLDKHQIVIPGHKHELKTRFSNQKRTIELSANENTALFNSRNAIGCQFKSSNFHWSTVSLPLTEIYLQPESNFSVFKVENDDKMAIKVQKHASFSYSGCGRSKCSTQTRCYYMHIDTTLDITCNCMSIHISIDYTCYCHIYAHVSLTYNTLLAHNTLLYQHNNVKPLNFKSERTVWLSANENSAQLNSHNAIGCLFEFLNFHWLTAISPSAHIQTQPDSKNGLFKHEIATNDVKHATINRIDVDCMMGIVCNLHAQHIYTCILVRYAY